MSAPAPRPPCPFLPAPAPAMDWRDLHRWREERGPGLYEAALRYAACLWGRDTTARAILALNRALYCELDPAAPLLTAWPRPYRALRWFLTHHPGDCFLGNPRVSYQHLAGRVRGDGAELKSWRSWAAWAVVRRALPDLPGDPAHVIAEPGEPAIAKALAALAGPEEATAWRAALRD